MKENGNDGEWKGETEKRWKGEKIIEEQEEGKNKRVGIQELRQKIERREGKKKYLGMRGKGRTETEKERKERVEINIE